jgi:histidine triad (HIT) family protein
MNEDSCIFCRIAQKQVPASLVYEDENVMAFLDIKPLNEGHTLVIPKAHYESIFEIPLDLAAYLHGVTKKIAFAVKKATGADGISISQQNGKAAGQEIFHFHVHVIPRYEGQKLPSFSEVSEADREKLSQTAAKIQKHL